ncbi:hypothetical protein [Rhodococcus sp. OK519]|uniref:hypothetical protein n=1 Tax=Rhodococcus sp. OK519 TaxID=2135729 RepID=UPI0011B1F298
MNRGPGTAVGFALFALGTLGTLGSILFYPLVGPLLGAFASMLPPLFVVIGVVGILLVGGAGKGSR